MALELPQPCDDVLTMWEQAFRRNRLIIVASVLVFVALMWPRMLGWPLQLAKVLLAPDYAIVLPGGYELWRVHSGAVLLIEPRNRLVVIMPNIDGYSVCRPLLVGHVSAAGLPADESKDSVPGYFLVDTRRGKVRQGLTEREWLTALRQYGIHSKPRLRKPSRYHQIFPFFRETAGKEGEKGTESGPVGTRQRLSR